MLFRSGIGVIILVIIATGIRSQFLDIEITFIFTSILVTVIIMFHTEDVLQFITIIMEEEEMVTKECIQIVPLHIEIQDIQTAMN